MDKYDDQNEKKTEFADSQVLHPDHDGTEQYNSYPDEKKHDGVHSEVLRPVDSTDIVEASHELEATVEDVAIAEEKMSSMTIEHCRAILEQVKKAHQHDQNFPADTLESITQFLENPDVAAHPEKHEKLINEMKLEAIMVTENSPYALVRANVDVNDDPSMPSLTFRVWFIGLIFAGGGAFMNQLFTIRQPGISISADVAQLLAFPAGKALEGILPTKQFSIFGRKFTLNPGKFNRKEHMLITIMANVAFSTPYTGNIIFAQALPMYFNQSYARSYGYQLINTLGSNFIGYGIAGLCRRFIVFPSFCVWPTSMTTMALNKAFHSDNSTSVRGPFNRIYTWTRMKFFYMAFIAMFIYFWFPNYIFQALSYFNWTTWIAPNNINLYAITGVIGGLGLNPLPTFDYNMANNGPLITPLFSITNQMIGMCFGFFMIIAFWYKNVWNTGYLPINSNKTFDNTGKLFNVSRIIDDKALFDNEKYQAYSEPWMAAGNITIYFWFFAAYSATVSYTALYHRYEIKEGFKSFYRSIKATITRKRRHTSQAEEEQEIGEDVHWRLMKAYPEVPELWYFGILCAATALGIAGLAAYPTNVSPAIAIYGLLLAFFFVIPIGLITAVTGYQITLNVLAEFIGGLIKPGDALTLNYYKMYGYITTAHAIAFCNDLKLAHYTKINPRHTFAVQVVATLVASLISTAIFNFQLDFPDVCTSDAAFKFTCPGVNTFFTAAVFWGTIGPQKLFGAGGRYKYLLLSFPVGFVMPLIQYGLQKIWPRSYILRHMHPVMLASGSISWAPYNFAYAWPGFVMTWISWGFVKKRYLDFRGRYNYVLAAAFGIAIALSAIVMFFGLAIPKIDIEWWGNTVPYEGCDAMSSTPACRRLTLGEGEYFGNKPGTFY